ncbi:MAG: hypothetical protein AAB885_00125 [Patescibacteria group bacterium]
MVDQPNGVKVQSYTWKDFEKDKNKILKILKSSGKDEQVKYVYGIPKGGLTLAVCIANVLKLELIESAHPAFFFYRHFINETIVVDDIADTGETLSPYSKNGFYIITLFKKPDSIVTPDIWIREKKEEWIEFPWEV